MNLSQQVAWVSVSERLPESVGKYILAHLNGDWSDGARSFGRDGTGEWIWKGRIVDEREITHWAEPLKHPDQLDAEQKETL